MSMTGGVTKKLKKKLKKEPNNSQTLKSVHQLGRRLY